MAEYIDKSEVLELKRDYGEGQYSMMLIDPALVKKLPTTDVVEREKYDELKSDYKLSVEAHKQSIKLYNKKVKELEDLNSKIDKAIEEIEQLINHSKLPTVNIYNRYSEGLKDCLEILKRNIGE